MNYSPDFIIATTVKRFLNPPSDLNFWSDYKKQKNKTPSELLSLIGEYISLDQLFQKHSLMGDGLLINYIRNLNGNTLFPISKELELFERKYFTPDDNEFYNRIIYEQEIKKLKEEVELLKIKANEAINAKKDFIKRDYEFIRQLGKGGFGTVSMVEHTVSNQFYAIKRLSEPNTDRRALIKKEIETLASFNHPNIIGFRTAFIVEDNLYLVMEYCSKGTLNDKLYSGSKLNEEDLIRLFIDLTRTFDFLHNKNIIHHDIKPSNILFDEEGTVKVSDFGCANSDIGTSTYLPPEIYEDEDYVPNVKSDIYSLGITLLECALGYNPLLEKTVQERFEIIKTGNLPISQLPMWLQDTILKAVHYEQLTRFDSMNEFYTALVKRNIPKFLDKSLIQDENEAKYLSYLVRNKKWIKANNFINSHPRILNNLNLIINTGNYYLKTHNIVNAKYFFEKALRFNPKAGIAKQIAEVYLQGGEPSKASYVLTEYINQNFTDIEAHNQLLYAYYLSGRWELGLEQSEHLLNLFPKESIIKNNHLLFSILLSNEDYDVFYPSDFKSFGSYNINVFTNNTPCSWASKGSPSLKSKLLFHEYTFRNIEKSNNEIEVKINGELYKINDLVISFGRTGYDYNTFSQFSGNSISRRHFVIVNMKNNVWLYDLNSTGVYVDGEKVYKKYFLLGFHKINIGNYEIEVKTDRQLLL